MSAYSGALKLRGRRAARKGFGGAARPRGGRQGAGPGCNTNVVHSAEPRRARATMAPPALSRASRRQASRSSPREIDGMDSAEGPGWRILGPRRAPFRRSDGADIAPLDPSSTKIGAAYDRQNGARAG